MAKGHARGMTFPTLDDPSLLRHLPFIDGAFRSTGTARMTVDDPATGKQIAEVVRVTESDIEAAIASAHAAFRPLAKQTARERAKVLAKLAALFVTHREDLARILTAEQGKPLTEARGEIDYAASFYAYYAEEAPRVNGELIPALRTDQRVMVMPVPVGVGAIITPWNFPHAMIARKLAPAYAVGCPVVIKPAGLTPLSALALAVLAQRAGFPKGALHVLTADHEDATRLGDTLCADTRIRKLSFTGSTAVGKMLLAKCAPTLKHVGLELGGNAPFLVFDDADLDAAVDGLMVAKFRNAGQTCVAANSVLVQASVHDAFVERLEARMRTLVVGEGTDVDVTIGPLIDTRAVAKVSEHVGDARTRGARVVLGGDIDPRGERFYAPTLMVGVDASMRMSCEETFGPVAGIVRFETEAEGLALANDTPYGLAAYAYARDLARVHRLIDGLDSGMVGLNTGLVSNADAPFGGVKESGLGREGSHHGVEGWIDRKYVCLGGLG